MEGTGKCYWRDCALLNAFFFFFPLSPFFFCVLNLVWQFYVSSPFAFPPLPLFIYLLLAPGAWEIIGSRLKVATGENSYHVLARLTLWS